MVAVNAGGPASLIEHGSTGLLAAAEPNSLAEAVLSLVAAPLLSERLRRAGLAAVRDRTWEAALERLATGYRRTLAERGAAPASRSVA